MAKKISHQPQAIILVGGEGTRLQPLTLTTPKPMLPVNGTPIVETQINQLDSINPANIALATSYKANIFKQYFNTHPNIVFSYEKTPLGTGGAIRQAYNVLPDAHPDTPIVIWNGDIVSDVNLPEMLKKFEKTNTDTMLALTPVDNPYDYGLVYTKRGRITQFVEKPSRTVKIQSNMINAGIYIMRRKTVEQFFSKNTAFSLERETFPTMVKSNIKMRAHILNGYWMDVGNPEKYLQTNLEVVQNAGQPDENYYHINNSLISKTAKISPTAEIHNSYIEAKTVIGDNTKIFNSYVGQKTVIKHGTTISRCTVGERATIGENNHLEDETVWNNGVIGDTTLP